MSIERISVAVLSFILACIIGMVILIADLTLFMPGPFCGQAKWERGRCSI